MASEVSATLFSQVGASQQGLTQGHWAVAPSAASASAMTSRSPVTAGGVQPTPSRAAAQNLTWSVVPSPDPSGYAALGGVSRVLAGRVHGCRRVSNPPRWKTLIESWNGTSWSVVPSPNPVTGGNLLRGVSCASAATCTAVGYSYTPRSSGAVRRTLVETGTAGR
jgi:hypothetical protein